MPKFELTPVIESLIALSAKNEIDEDTTTKDMVEYGLRNLGTDTEFHLANRLQKLRCVALELIEQLDEEGYSIDPLLLQLIDVNVEVVKKERFSVA